MIQDVIKRLSVGMHDRCELHLTGSLDPDILIYVRDSLRKLDLIKHNLSPQARNIHEALLQSQKNQPPEEFIERVYGLCCGYTI